MPSRLCASRSIPDEARDVDPVHTSDSGSPCTSIPEANLVQISSIRRSRCPYTPPPTPSRLCASRSIPDEARGVDPMHTSDSGNPCTSIPEANSVSLCNIDADNEMNEELEEIATTEQICMSTQTNDEPRVGLEFNCTEDAKKFHNDYAFKMGFSIRKTYHYKAKKYDDAITSVAYCCSKAGHSKSQTHEERHCQNFKGSNTPKKQFPNRRSGCKAHIVLRIDDRGK
ncbi:hypothetical protein ACMD2_24183 [Ananas comosus]|uniref:FAR1 domain-containing protein n=1 Tax=Ananas comosus TaxID=4615 RepID=A0A199VJA7_ANACO|nr:hypothetical protein ACMD2_24183 [Ananas comosus]